MHGPQPINVVLAHGCFDVLHPGHIRHLQEARAQGDRLVVSVTADAHVRKGVGRPVFSAELRAESLRALDCVDDVVISSCADAVDVIEQIKPAVYVKGVDYAQVQDAALQREIAAVEAHGGRFHVTRTDKWSSSRIINGTRLGADALGYLDRVRTLGWRDRIASAFERADALNILFVGETIVDEYRYVSPLAKPSKEFILATVEAREPEQFLGGVIAASLHADWKNAKVCTVDQPITKTRFVDADFSRKLFEVYSRQRLELDGAQAGAFGRKLVEGVAAADCVVVFDFGHGLLGRVEREWISEKAKFVAVNAQTNAGNYGFNPVTKYTRADLVCVDEPEARVASGNAKEGFFAMDAGYIHHHVHCGKVIVTRGRFGAFTSDSKVSSGGHVPAFASRTLDTMGAGDAFLATAAPLVAAGLDLEIAAFVGNVAGAIKTDIVGHRRHVERAELIQTVEALLK